MTDTKLKQGNVLPMNLVTQRTVPKQIESGIIDSKGPQEESIMSMSQETYSQSEIDLKFDKISAEIQHSSEKSDLKFDTLTKQIDLKFDNFERRIENILLSQENKRLEEQAKNKKEFMFWAIGILVALAGIAIPIWFGK